LTPGTVNIDTGSLYLCELNRLANFESYRIPQSFGHCGKHQTLSIDSVGNTE
jgi:hypothetical protein